ncbi:hypothetical protein RM574_16895 [Streptomyces sp. DSM 41982]|uniref:DUF559 domain-containing protein n=1 Tax=Streptomyces evansiae TaxID=3075535 RepID=A0ABD5E980_9ACTN|nr:MULTISPECIES: hypothetical protein [unclassified Streptomyces]MDT0417167.1 hypothetical protein [Streptomyces sp. DSM 41982]SCE18343.1 hypothetical protein GA0115246_112133 [Streptomyces sp. SolWspMP-sol7th]
MTHLSSAVPASSAAPAARELPVTGPHLVADAAQLRARGISTARLTARCAPGGGWQRLLPGVFLLRSGRPTTEERLHAAVRYARRPPAGRARGVPAQPTSEESRDPGTVAMITGPAALALHGFPLEGPVGSLATAERYDVLVPRTRRLRSTAFVRIVRGAELPAPQQVTGVPTAPVTRALADTVAELSDAGAVTRLLGRAVREGYCGTGALLAELRRCGLMNRPCVLDAMETLLREDRGVAEERLYRMVEESGLPDPAWNVELRLPQGPSLGTVDAYWPEQAVAVELDTRVHRPGEAHEPDATWTESARKRERLELLGITLLHLTPRKLRDAAEQQSCVVRTALLTAADREPAAYVEVLPR